MSKAEWRKGGHPDDLARPLTPAGRAESALLARLLRCFARARVISSAARALRGHGAAVRRR